MFRPKKDEVSEKIRVLHNEELNDLYRLPCIVSIAKYWKTTMGEARNTHRKLGRGKPLGNRKGDGRIPIRWMSKKQIVGDRWH
jgi:hypothetical protein